MVDKHVILATESNPVQEELAMHYREIIRLLGEDPDREGLLKTPKRVAKAMQFLSSFIACNYRNAISVFADDMGIFAEIIFKITGRIIAAGGYYGIVIFKFGIGKADICCKFSIYTD